MEKPNLGSRESRGKPPYIFKALISPEECAYLKDKFKFEDYPTNRFYMYFDTSLSSGDAQLLKNNIRLRVKMKGSSTYVLEIKCGREYEIFQEISPQDYQSMLMGEFPEGEIKTKLEEAQLFLPFKMVDIVNTVRSKANFRGGELIIDHTSSHSKVEYEVEFRSPETFSQDQINSIKEELKISQTQTQKSKLERFWEGR